MFEANLFSEEDASPSFAFVILKSDLPTHHKVYALVSHLNSDIPSIREQGEAALKQLPAVANEAMINSLSHPHPGVRRQLIRIICSRQKPTELAPVLGRILDDPVESVRHEAALQLSRIGAPAYPILSEALDSKIASRASAASLAIHSLHADAWPLWIDLLDTSDSELRERSIRMLTRSGHEAVGPLIDELKTESPVARENAYNVLLQLENTALPNVREALSNDTSIVREKACALLGSWGDEDAILPLCNMFRDADSDVRTAAA